HAIDTSIVVISKNRTAAARFIKAKDVNVIDIPWWMWDETDLTALLECLLEGTKRILTQWPKSIDWVLGGVAETLGDTPLEMRRNSRHAVQGWQALLPNANVQIRPHEFSNYYYAWSTVGQINLEARRVLSGS
ncbi:hypothetical protein LCGC14_2890220, partial [marine sediment metagenome]